MHWGEITVEESFVGASKVQAEGGAVRKSRFPRDKRGAGETLEKRNSELRKEAEEKGASDAGSSVFWVIHCYGVCYDGISVDWLHLGEGNRGRDQSDLVFPTPVGRSTWCL